MIISHKHSFVFIKTRKVAGTSIEKALLPCLNIGDVYIHHLNQPIRKCVSHSKWTDVRRHWPVVWDKYYSFTVERNPWDKVVSFYWWEKAIEKHKGNEFPPFGIWFDNKPRGALRDWTWYANSLAPKVNRVLLYDHIQDEFDSVCIKLALPIVKLPQKHAHIRLLQDHYSLYYTDRRRDLIDQQFAKEISTFGFQFEDKR